MRIKTATGVAIVTILLLLVLSGTGMASYHLCVGPICVYSDPVNDTPLVVKMKSDTPNPMYIKKPKATATQAR
ncbi:MAG: hypothetical protein U0Y82_05690 [Thermoleophilia bacterium]